MGKKLKKQDFLDKARAVHGDKYCYSEAVYVNVRTKLTIICPIHGAFEQTGRGHLKGNGCKKCADADLCHTTESFVKKAKAVHGEKYTYDKVDYKHSKTAVVATCPIHGDFSTQPANHLMGNGCMKCALKERTKTKAQWVELSRKHHSDKYDYSKSEYTIGKNKITITCPDHGDFEQIASDHQAGAGCPRCHSFTGKTRMYLVELDNRGERLLKLGITNYTTERRYKKREDSDPTLVREIAYTDFEDRQDALDIESYLLERYKDNRYTPTSRFGGYTECLSFDILETLKEEFENIPT